jgi:TctA family transporter
MLEAYASALEILFQPINLLVLLAAVIFGLIVGVIPGLSGLIALSLILPFIFHMPLEIALILIIALHAVVFTGGSISAILLNLPGTAPNAATTLDGYPMSQRGEGARAIGASVTSSMFGGVIPVFFALAMVPAIMPMVIAFGQPEMAALVLLGLSFLGVLSSGSFTKGILSGMLGLLISFIGYHSITGVHRFSYGTAFLFDGIEIIPLVLGLFGLSELLYLAMRGQQTIARRAVSAKLTNVFEGAKDVWRHKWLWFRSTILGYVIGVIPGIGAEVATWACYGQARQTSKYPERFGTGVVEGVIAPEAANNAKEAGSLLTTMALGIPGSTVMVIILAALMMVGITPGPMMMDEHLPLALTLLLGIALANVVGGIICLIAAPYLARVASVNIDFISTGVLILMLAGVFAVTLAPLNFIVVICFGLLGLVMKLYGYSRPALILGFVLGALFENYTLLSLKIYGPLFFFRPIPIVMFVIIFLMLGFPYIRRAVSHQRGRFMRA